MDINNFVSGVTTNISNQTAPKSIPSTVVGQALVDLANLTKNSLDLKLDISGSTVFLTGITKNQVTTALNFTPASATTTLAGYGITSGDTLFNGRFLTGITSFLGTDVTPTNNQLFDKNSQVIDGYVITISGGTTAGTGRKSTKIPGAGNAISVTVNGLVGLGVTGSKSYRFTDTSGNFISGSSATFLTQPATLISPSGYTNWNLEFTIKNVADADDGTYSTNVMVNYGASALTFQAYSGSSIVKQISNQDIQATSLKSLATLPVAGTGDTSVMNKLGVTSILGNYATKDLIPAVTYISTPTYGAQLFDKTNFLQDTNISSTGGLFPYPPTSSSINARTAKILLPDSGQTQIKATGFQHLGSSAYRWCFHDATDTLIAGAFGNISAESVSVLNIPTGATSWYITYRHPTLDDNTAGDNLMVNYGSSAMTYQPYSGVTLNKTLTSVAGAVVKTISDSDLLAYAKKTYVNAFMPYAGLKLATLGDSITRGLTWQQPLADLTGMIFNSDWVTDATKPLGIGGSRITPAIATGVTGQEATQSIYYRADYVSGYSPDVIILFGGQNDSRLTGYTLTDAPYTGGELVAGDPAMPSFVSAYKGTLVKLLSQNPYAKVVAMTPMYNGSVISAYTSSIWASYKLRNDTIKAICEMYSVQFVDLMGLVGITPYNAALLYGDASIHPNALGGVRMARLIVGVLQ